MEDSILDIAVNFSKTESNPGHALAEFIDFMDHKDKRFDDACKLQDIMFNTYNAGKKRGYTNGVSAVIEDMCRTFKKDINI